MSATIDWSYRLLSENEQAVLRSLGVFVGKFSLEVAQAAAGDCCADETNSDVLEVLEALLSKSMLTVATTGVGLRYRLLDTTRTYLRGLLAEEGESEAVSRRHAIYFQDRLERQRSALSVSADRKSEIQDDVAHFLSCCLGQETHEAGDGLPIDRPNGDLWGGQCPSIV